MPVVANTADGVLIGMFSLCILLFLVVASVWRGRPADVIVARYRSAANQGWEINPLQVLSDVAEMVECRTCRAAYNYMRSLTNWFYAHRSYLSPELSCTWMIVQRRLTRIVSLESYHQDWSEREIALLRRDILSRISRLLDQSGDRPPERRNDAPHHKRIPHGSRYTSAPIPRSRSSSLS